MCPARFPNFASSEGTHLSATALSLARPLLAWWRQLQRLARCGEPGTGRSDVSGGVPGPEKWAGPAEGVLVGGGRGWRGRAGLGGVRQW